VTDRKSKERIFSTVGRNDFVGRDAELDAILAHVRGEGITNRLAVLAAPRVGASELLRQAFDTLFARDEPISPVYFQIKTTDITAQETASRFLYEFVLQMVARSRHDGGIIASSPDLNELAELATPADGHWVDRLVAMADARGVNSSPRTLLSAPMRAAAGGADPFVIIDDVHVLEQIDGGGRLLAEFIDIFSRSSVPVVLGGLRRYLFGRLQADIIDLDALAQPDAVKLAETRAARLGIGMSDQTCHLVSVQARGIPGNIAAIIDTAATNGRDLDTFDAVENIYTDEILGGSIGRWYDSVVRRAGDEKCINALLAGSLDAPDGRTPMTYWERQVLDTGALRSLHDHEIVNIAADTVTVDADDTILADYVRSRVRLGGVSSRALAVGMTLTDNIKRAPSMMARSYRRSAAIGLRDLLAAFDGRQLSPVLLDYELYKTELKGAGDDKIRKSLKDDNRRTRLPQIFFAADTAYYYPRLRQVCDRERSAVGIGFTDGARRQETAWLAAEIDSKLEAKRDVAEFWCDRLEMVAAACEFSNFTIWLIAPEGFTCDAIEMLRERKAFGTSRRQVELLAEMLKAEAGGVAEPAAGEKYEFTVAMGEEGEIATARAVDDIGRRHNLPGKMVNQLKTAIIEACINAAEHSLSPDGKIHEKFLVAPDRVVVTVSNRGVRLADRSVIAAPDEARRGWGLKLMKGLMDTVEVSDTDDGTSITMTKSILPAEASEKVF
jgi:serine/threonine-protein kinase RsbW